MDEEALVKMTKLVEGKVENRYEVYKLVKEADFRGNTPLTNVRCGSIILVLFLTKQ